MAALATYVHVRDPDGHMHVFGPGDELPTWATSAIRAEKAYAGQPPASARTAGQAPAGADPAPAATSSSKRSSTSRRQGAKSDSTDEG